MKPPMKIYRRKQGYSNNSDAPTLGIENLSLSPNCCLSAFSFLYSAGPGPSELSWADSDSLVYNFFLASLEICIMKFCVAVDGPPSLLPIVMPSSPAGLRLL